MSDELDALVEEFTTHVADFISKVRNTASKVAPVVEQAVSDVREILTPEQAAAAPPPPVDPGQVVVNTTDPGPVPVVLENPPNNPNVSVGEDPGPQFGESGVAKSTTYSSATTKEKLAAKIAELNKQLEAL